MPNLCAPKFVTVKSETNLDDLDLVPLTTRLSSKQTHHRSTKTLRTSADAVAEEEDTHRDKQGCLSLSYAKEQNQDGNMLNVVTSRVVNSNIPDFAAVGSPSGNTGHSKCITVPVNQKNQRKWLSISDYPEQVVAEPPAPSNICGIAEVGCLDDKLLSSSEDGVKESASIENVVKAIESIPAYYGEDELDHLPLSERRRRLLARTSVVRLAKPAFRGNSAVLPGSSTNRCAVRMKKKVQSIDRESGVEKNLSTGTCAREIFISTEKSRNISDRTAAEVINQANQYSPVDGHCEGKMSVLKNNQEGRVYDSLPVHLLSQGSSAVLPGSLTKHCAGRMKNNVQSINRESVVGKNLSTGTCGREIIISTEKSRNISDRTAAEGINEAKYSPVDGHCEGKKSVQKNNQEGRVYDSLPVHIISQGDSALLPEIPTKHCAVRMKENVQFIDRESMVGKYRSTGTCAKEIFIPTEQSRNISDHTAAKVINETNQYSHVDGHCEGKMNGLKKNHEGRVYDSLPEHMNSTQQMTLQTSVKVKNERLDGQNLDINYFSGVSTGMAPIKNEVETSFELGEDIIDHMTLYDRLRLRTSAKDSECNPSTDPECSGNTLPSASDDPIMSEFSEPLKVHRPRKRKKTATDSAETALEEDAPELLQVLAEEGVAFDNMKLYGASDIDDSLEGSVDEESFSELEDVISKLWSHRNTFLKVAHTKSSEGSKPNYCLAALLTLVEQTRYLQFRKWPVEWGWCRDLQSFLFVFERHKRIVLERPEYGYATYFFELIDTAPINWQINRLVTSMKLTNCGRFTLVEDKPLMVGKDLTEGEARVLIEYGWIPNTGLGSMLNYRDRVVHDRNSKKIKSEWRSKLGKLLMDGYNGGALVSTTRVDVLSTHPVKMEDTDSTI